MPVLVGIPHLHQDEDKHKAPTDTSPRPLVSTPSPKFLLQKSQHFTIEWYSGSKLGDDVKFIPVHFFLCEPYAAVFFGLGKH